jgi:non-specific serine/threonine protein kinase
MGQMHALAGEPRQAIERCERGLRRGARGEVWVTSWLNTVIGLALFHQGDHEASAEAHYRALPMMLRLEDILNIGFSVEMIAWLAAGQQRYGRAAWLLGAAGGAFDRDGEHVNGYPVLAGPHAEAERATREALGSDRYDALYRTGFDYPLDQLIAHVVADADTLPLPAGDADAAGDGARARVDPLTNREREIAALVAEGLSNRDIAARLIISKRTVDAHVEHIFSKLGVSSRVQLVNWLRS